MAWSEVLPVGYVAVATVTAACGPRSAWGNLRDAPATSLFCGRDEVERGLVEQAGRHGGSVLAHERCRQEPSGRLACTATVARPKDHGASVLFVDHAGPAALDSDALPTEVASRIAIDLEPSVRVFARRARGGAEVRESPLLPVGHMELGLMRARCAADVCDPDQTRAGLRAAAGGLGVSDLIGVRCATFDGEQSCVATLAATEGDSDSDHRAN